MLSRNVLIIFCILRMSYNKLTYCCAVLMHWMTKFVVFGCSAEEEAHLAHIEIEAFQASISESNNRIFLANVAFRLLEKRRNC